MERFGYRYRELLSEDPELIRLLEIEARGRPREEGPGNG